MNAPATINVEALVAAVDGIIYNALSSAGARILVKPPCPRSERAEARKIPLADVYASYPVRAEEVDQYRLLIGAWDRVPEIAARYGVDADCLVRTLDAYTRALIVARLPHAFTDVPLLLRTPCLQEAA